MFRFVEEKEGLDFAAAVESLAERTGVELERENEDPQGGGEAAAEGALWELLERTAKFYERYLWESPKAEKARAYLAERGLGEDVLRRFGVGMAPSAVGPGADREPAGGVQGRGAARGRACRRRGGRAGTTTASGTGSRSRSATSAGGCSGSGRGR